MSEKVTRRGIIQRLFIDGVEAAGRLFADASQPGLSPEEAGLSLRSRAGKKGFHSVPQSQTTMSRPERMHNESPRGSQERSGTESWAIEQK